MNLNQVTMSTTDMHAAITFYKKLGFALIVDTPHYARFACPDEGATFSLLLSDQVESSTTLYFEHQALDDWVAELQGKDIEFDQLPTDQPYLWREAQLRDPSGNKIKLYRAGENRLNPPWRVNPD